MKPKVLFIVADDPRTSARPAEAIRIVAGVRAWEMAEISLYLRDAVVLALSEHAEELADGENYARYLPILANSGGPIYVERSAPQRFELASAALPYEEVSDQQLAALAASSDYVFRF